MKLRNLCPILAVLAVVLCSGLLTAPAAAADETVYEIRTYTTPEGKLPNLLARFRNHTTKIFESHGMKNVGYWVPADAPKSENTLIYILEHKSREAAKASWDAFRKDPAWIEARDESQKDGKLVSHIESVFVKATDFSAIR
jgi:hypothetical protein